ncbi:MAG: hypothetical protein IAG10_35675 [Planctomycetaceae bacterium]|nr:hypothetical protein [Planctomycetaceae bacterium]
MQPESPLNVQWDISLWSLLMIGVFLGGLFVAFIAVRRSSQTTQIFAKFFVLGAVLLAVIVLWTFASHVRLDEGPRIVSSPPRVLPSVSTSASESPRILAPSSADAATASESIEAESSKPGIEFPEWTRQLSRVDGANTFVVVKSGRFATVEEAELHALDEAGQTTARHFRNLDPSGVGQCVPIQRELVRESAIRDRFEEISRHDFGTMKNFPMHQVWLRVELSPQLGERIAEPWRQAAVAARLRTLTGWSIWGTAAAALIAFALRLDSAWNGRRRTVVVGTTVALMLGSLAFLA